MMISKIVACFILMFLPVTGKAGECYGIAYAANKLPSSILQVPAAAQNYQDVDELAEAIKLPSRIILKSSGLDSIPNEIARIRKGFVHHYVGALINDGNVYWSGIDLERALAIVVSRKIYDTRAQITRPFGEPKFKSWDKQSFVRKWISGDRTETEVVLRRGLAPDEAEAFVCVANALWRSDEKVRSMLPSDALESEDTLLEYSAQDNAVLLYKKFVNRAGPLNAVLSNVWRTMPVVDYGGNREFFSPESRQKDQSCNSNSDCQGTLKCGEGICTR